MDARPLISIVIPTRDRAALLGETLDSIRAQAYDNWEAIVVDDHSKDDTVKEMVEASARDARIRFISLTEKTGAPAARNLGVENARGEFVIYLDSDDLLAPHCLAERVEVVNAYPQLDFAVFPCQLFRQTPGDTQLLWNRKTEENDLDRFLKLDVPWQTTSPIWRRQSLAKVGGWDETVKSAQDWEFHIRAVVAGLKHEWFDRGEMIGQRWKSRADCYWRRASSERDSIGKQSFGPEHIRGRRDVVIKMQKVIETARMMTPQRKEMFAGMYFDAAERMADRVSRKEAREIWRDAYRVGVITKQQRLQGLQYFHLFHWEGWRKSRRGKLDREWPANFFIRTRGDYLRTPVVRGETPAISIVMSAYNAQTYLNEAIDSIVNQTFGDWEFIIIDDGSKDKTLGILREYEARDKRFRIISRPNTGLTKALNEGVAAARGEFIARMDADDVAMPRRFEWQVDYLRAHPDCVLLGGQVELIDPLGLRIGMDSHKLEHKEIEAALLRGKGGAVVHPATMMRTDAVEKIGAYREHFNNSEDLDLFLRLAEVGQIANLPDVLLKYRRHPQSVSHLKYENQWKLNRQIVSEAYERRGGKLPADWEFVPWKPKAMPEQLREWAWAALKAGKISAARTHAVGALKKSPLSSDSWRLMYCAIRGR